MLTDLPSFRVAGGRHEKRKCFSDMVECAGAVARSGSSGFIVQQNKKDKIDYNNLRELENEKDTIT